MFIVSITYLSPIEEIERFLAEHVDYLDVQYGRGTFQLSGRKVPRTGGVIIATAQNREELDAILSKDPFYREGLARYEVIEFMPTKSTPVLAFLIEKQSA